MTMVQEAIENPISVQSVALTMKLDPNMGLNSLFRFQIEIDRDIDDALNGIAIPLCGYELPLSDGRQCRFIQGFKATGFGDRHDQ